MAFKNSTRLGSAFHVKYHIPKNLNFSVESYYGEFVRHLALRTDEHIGISSLTKKQVKPKNSSVDNHLLFCNHLASYNDFSILTCENKVLTRTEIEPVNTHL